MFSIKEYKKVESLEEAFLLNQKRSNRVLGGMLWLKMSKATVHTAIDLSGLGLDQIEETEQAFSIGCMTPLRALELHEGLNRYTGGAMKEALTHIVGVQFRNLATVGGSIYGRFGFSDVLTMLLAMDSFAELYKGGVIPLWEFVNRPADRDILVRIIIKKEKAAFSYQSVRNQAKTDFPVLTCAVALPEQGPVRLSVGARPGRAVRIVDEAGILRTLKNGTEQEQASSLENFKAFAREQILTGSNLRGSAGYRTHLVGVLTGRAIKEAAKQR